MALYSVIKFCTLDPLQVMNKFELEQRWDLMEICFQNKNNYRKLYENIVQNLKIAVLSISKTSPSSYSAYTRNYRNCVAKSEREIPSTSTCHRTQEMNVSPYQSMSNFHLI